VATIVAFHAHPDDELLLTGGTIARLAAEGNRVIITRVRHAELGDHAPDRRPPACGAEAGSAGGAPDTGIRQGTIGQVVSPADQIALAGIPRYLRDRMVRRTRGTDRRTRRLRRERAQA
jgi:hypothetical protein